LDLTSLHLREQPGDDRNARFDGLHGDPSR